MIVIGYDESGSWESPREGGEGRGGGEEAWDALGNQHIQGIAVEA